MSSKILSVPFDRAVLKMISQTRVRCHQKSPIAASLE